MTKPFNILTLQLSCLLSISFPNHLVAQEISSWCQFLEDKELIGTFFSELRLGSDYLAPWLIGERFWFSVDEPSANSPSTVELLLDRELIDSVGYPGTVEYTIVEFGAKEVAVRISDHKSGTIVDTGCEQTGLGGPFRINIGLNDAWYDSDIPGQGALITVYPSVKTIFLALFTFDTEMSPESTHALVGSPDHRWLTAQGLYEGNRAFLQIYNTSEGRFMDSQTIAVTEAYGSAVLEFDSCLGGTLIYEIPSVAVSGEWALQRITLDRMSLCESLRGDFDE